VKGLIKRNLLIFFKDKATAFFSLFGALIVLVLYIFFLGDLVAQDVAHLGDQAKPFVFAWVFSGMISITSFTATFAAFASMVSDKMYKTEKDFVSSPLPRMQITFSYWISAIVVGTVMSIAILIFSLIYLAILGMEAYSFVTILEILGLILLSTISNTAVLLVLSMFINSVNTFSAFTAIFSASLGFFSGTYVQIGVLSSFMQWVVKVMPVSHSAGLFRKVMLKSFFEGKAFEGAPPSVIESARKSLGVDFYFGNNIFPVWASILILIVVFIIFITIAVLLRMRKKKN